ncbi:MAG TPA: universal stress protein [Candidatus Binataceae bacterium]|nr:universal stress protein [Candidatus Binataceae bacterium]
MFQRILCPVDFDDNSIEALRLARRLALRDEGKLYLLHVVPPTDPLVVSAPRVAQQRESDARTGLKRTSENELKGVEHETLLRHGHPAEEVVKAAKELKADLVVMATHGRRGLSHLVIGSVAEKVVRESTAPVLTVRMQGHGATSSAV